MRAKLSLLVGVLMIAGGLLGASLTYGTSNAYAQGDQDITGQMTTMMDSMMGQGFTDQMRATIPNFDQMVDNCASAADGNTNGMMNGNMDGMMNGMMNGNMNSMMNRGADDSPNPATPEAGN